MNAIELLKQQHKEVDALFERYEKLGASAVHEKEQIFVQIADMLAAHASLEEKLFYPAVNSEGTEDILLESAEEHLATKRVLADLLDITPSDETFDAKMTVLKDLVQHHVKVEEQSLFPKVRKLADKQALEDLGVQMEALFEELRESEPRASVPAETDHPATIQ